jgi:DNA-binding HxlR family transcriptional regulator
MAIRFDGSRNGNIHDDLLHSLLLLTHSNSASVLQAIAGGAKDLQHVRQAVGPHADEASLLSTLHALTDCGAAARSVDPGPPLHVHYRLTPAGNDLLAIVSSASEWTERWARDSSR